jgi:hypothetical protein
MPTKIKPAKPKPTADDARELLASFNDEIVPGIESFIEDVDKHLCDGDLYLSNRRGRRSLANVYARQYHLAGFLKYADDMADFFESRKYNTELVQRFVERLRDGNDGEAMNLWPDVRARLRTIIRRLRNQIEDKVRELDTRSDAPTKGKRGRGRTPLPPVTLSLYWTIRRAHERGQSHDATADIVNKRNRSKGAVTITAETVRKALDYTKQYPNSNPNVKQRRHSPPI